MFYEHRGPGKHILPHERNALMNVKLEEADWTRSLVITFTFEIEGKAEYLIQERNRTDLNVIVIIVCFKLFNTFQNKPIKWICIIKLP